jgi:glycosyltransferase involved in cell wall biosynthesis
MAASVPVVATHQGGAIEMLENNVSGLFIPINNAIEAANIMEPLITSAAARKNMGEQAKKRIQEKFSRKHFNELIVACIEQQQ